MKPEEQMEPKGREQAVTEPVLERLGAQALAEADKAEERLKGGYYMQLAEESLEKGTGGKTIWSRRWRRRLPPCSGRPSSWAWRSRRRRVWPAS